MPDLGQYDPWESSSSSEEDEAEFDAAMKQHQNYIMMAYHLGLIDCRLDRLPKEVWKHLMQNDLFVDMTTRWPLLSPDLEDKMYLRYFRVDKQTFEAPLLASSW